MGLTSNRVHLEFVKLILNYAILLHKACADHFTKDLFILGSSRIQMWNTVLFIELFLAIFFDES